jgi:hypothetical protein
MVFSLVGVFASGLAPQSGGWPREIAPPAPAIPTRIDCQLLFVPADGIRLLFSVSGEFGTSPFWGSS